MVKKVDIWNDNIYTDNFRLFFDDLDITKPEKIILTKADDDKNNPPNKWEFEIVDKEYIDTADAILQAQIDVINEEISDDYCKLIECDIIPPDMPNEVGEYLVTATAEIVNIDGKIDIILEGTCWVYTNEEDVVAKKMRLEKAQINVKGVAVMVAVINENKGLAYAIVDRILVHDLADAPIEIADISYTKLTDLENRVEHLETEVATHEILINENAGRIYQNETNIAYLQDEMKDTFSFVHEGVSVSDYDFPTEDGEYKCNCLVSIQYEAGSYAQMDLNLFGYCSVMDGRMGDFNLIADKSYDHIAYSAITFRAGQEIDSPSLYMVMTSEAVELISDITTQRMTFEKTNDGNLLNKITDIKGEIYGDWCRVKQGTISQNASYPLSVGIFFAEQTIILHKKDGTNIGMRVYGICARSTTVGYDFGYTLHSDYGGGNSNIAFLTATYASDAKLFVSALMPRYFYEEQFDRFEAYEPTFKHINITTTQPMLNKSVNLYTSSGDDRDLHLRYIIGEHTISFFGSYNLPKYGIDDFILTLQEADLEAGISFEINDIEPYPVASGIFTKSDNGGGYETSRIEVYAFLNRNAISIKFCNTPSDEKTHPGFALKNDFIFNFTLPIKRRIK